MRNQIRRDRKRVLLAWELGGGNGHTRRLLSLADALIEGGWELVFAVRDIYALSREMTVVASYVVQAPIHHKGWAPPKFGAANFGDILAISGCGSIEPLFAMVSAWEGLIENIRPDVIIADYAPYISIAAKELAPVIQIGSSFALPPGHLNNFPVLQKSKGSGFHEEQLLENVVAVQKKRGKPIPKSLPQATSGDRQIVCVTPIFDIYHESRLTPATGPIVSVQQPVTMANNRSLFIYLAADYKLTAKVLQSVIQSNVHACGFVRNASPALLNKCKKLGLDISPRPLPMNKALNDCSVILHHGGIGTTESAAVAGRAQLLLPRHLEQRLTCSKAEALNIASRININDSVDELAARIKEFLDDKSTQQSAQDVAREIEAMKPFRSLELILEAAEELAGEKSYQ